MSQGFPDRNNVKTNNKKKPLNWIFSVGNRNDPNPWIRIQVPNRVTRNQTRLAQQNQGFSGFDGNHVGLLSVCWMYSLAYLGGFGFKVCIDLNVSTCSGFTSEFWLNFVKQADIRCSALVSMFALEQTDKTRNLLLWRLIKCLILPQVQNVRRPRR